jgi:hypothetical protein
MHRKKAASFYLAGSGSEGAMFVKMTDGTFYAVGYGGESMIPDDDDEYATTLMPVAF